MSDLAFFFHSPLNRSQQTVGEIIRDAMRKLGIVDATRPITADEIRDGLNDLNGILEQWSLESLNVYRVGDISFPTIVGQSVYRIGPGEYIAADRPASVEAAYDNDNPGLNIEVIEYPISGEIQGRVLAYDPAFPSGFLNFGWAPQGERITLKVSQELQRYETSTEPHGLPPGYAWPLTLALALAIAPDYDVIPGPALEKAAATAKKTLRTISSRLRAQPLRTGIGRINRGFPTNYIRGV